MADKFNCAQCGAPYHSGDTSCKYCGEEFIHPNAQIQQATPNPQVIINQSDMFQQTNRIPQEPPYRLIPQKSKVAAGLLAIFLGGIGVHKFYLNKPIAGIVYLLLCWTSIPFLLGLIEGIIYLCTPEEKFHNKYGGYITERQWH